MVIETTHSDVTSSGVAEVTQSRIVASAQMIKLLSSGLYTDKIKAVIRELSANAIDAMKVAGTLESHRLKVHLPTAIESWFSIRDYGTGLSDEGIKRVYINYGASTKSLDNEQIGGFGVGSKAPFSYTDQYIIKSYYNGKLNTYNYGIGSLGIPELSKISTTNTDEHNGIEIHMQVKGTDIRTFETKAADIYKWFDHKPDTNYPIGYPIDTPILKTRYGFLYRKYGTYNKIVDVRMGGIVYNVDTNIWGYSDDITSLLYDSAIFIELNIGDVTVTASREKVENTDRNKAVLTEAITNIVKSTHEEYNRIINDPELSEWDKVSINSSSYSNAGRFSKILGITSMKVATLIARPDGYSFFVAKLQGSSSCKFRSTSNIDPSSIRLVILADTPTVKGFEDCVSEYCVKNTIILGSYILLIRQNGGVTKSKPFDTDYVLDKIGKPNNNLVVKLSTILSSHSINKADTQKKSTYDFTVYPITPYKQLALIPNLFYRVNIDSISSDSLNYSGYDYIFYYVSSKTYMFPTLYSLVESILPEKTKFRIVAVAKSNTKLIAKDSRFTNIVDFINASDISTVYDVTDILGLLNSFYNVPYSYIKSYVDSYDACYTKYSRELLSMIDFISTNIVGDTDSIKFLGDLGIKFKVSKVKIPTLLKDFQDRFFSLPTVSGISGSIVVKATHHILLAGELLPSSKISMFRDTKIL